MVLISKLKNGALLPPDYLSDISGPLSDQKTELLPRRATAIEKSRVATLIRNG